VWIKLDLKNLLFPGDQLKLSVSIEKRIKGFWKYKGVALVENKVVA
jgi:3-hydroxymyristoyl/3-hydroxydecanoyl-(acyl carrier protein) dehydratase